MEDRTPREQLMDEAENLQAIANEIYVWANVGDYANAQKDLQRVIERAAQVLPVAARADLAARIERRMGAEALAWAEALAASEPHEMHWTEVA